MNEFVKVLRIQAADMSPPLVLILAMISLGAAQYAPFPAGLWIQPTNAFAYEGDPIYFTFQWTTGYSDMYVVRWYVNDKSTDQQSHYFTLPAGFSNNTKVSCQVTVNGAVQYLTVYAWLATAPQVTGDNIPVSFTGGSREYTWDPSKHIVLRLFPEQSWSIDMTGNFIGHDLHYQWTKNGNTINDPVTTTNNAHIHSTLSTELSGAVYQLAVSNRLGTVTSPRIVLRLNTPELIAFPEDIYVYSGEYIDVVAQFEESSQPQMYFWQLDMAPVITNEPNFRMKATTDLDNAKLTVVATNLAGTSRTTAVIHVYIPKWAIAVIVIGSALILGATALVLFKACRAKKLNANPKEAVFTFEDKPNTVGISLDDD